MVSTYLVHHGYCNTAEAFAHITEQPFNEDIVSIKNRQSKFLLFNLFINGVIRFSLNANIFIS